MGDVLLSGKPRVVYKGQVIFEKWMQVKWNNLKSKLLR